MVVWKRHGTEPAPSDIEWMIRCLTKAAVERFGDEVTSVDRVMRQIPEHFHAHARDKNWLSRRWQDKPSKYSGVGGSRELLS
jgi:hypothetical protein